MTINKRVHEIIKAHEGLRLNPYRCTAGRWTIGYGHNLENHGKPMPDSITRQEAEQLLDADIASAEDACMLNMPYFGMLDEVRRAVLIDMCFNLGINGLLGFRKTLACVAEGKYTAAGAEMASSKWAGQVGYRAHRLGRMMAYGAWPNDIPALSLKQRREE